MPASVVLPRPGRPADHDQLPGTDLHIEAVEEAPVAVGDRDAAQLEAGGGERDHAAVGDGPRAERQHLGDAVLRARAGTARRWRARRTRCENWLRPCADLEREEERADGEVAGAQEVGADGEQSCLHEQGHHLQEDVVPGEEPGAGHREAEGALGDVGDAAALLVFAAERLDHPDAAHRLVDGAW